MQLPHYACAGVAPWCNGASQGCRDAPTRLLPELCTQAMLLLSLSVLTDIRPSSLDAASMPTLPSFSGRHL